MALSNYGRALERRTALQAARDEAEVAARITRAQQREGQIDSLAQLDAERTFANTEATLALADAQISRAQINVFRALGGQWQAGESSAVEQAERRRSLGKADLDLPSSLAPRTSTPSVQS